jgi:acetolactate synthase-1/2/3 large subunit
VDVDSWEIGKNYPTQVPVGGDARAVLRELTFHSERELAKSGSSAELSTRDAYIKEFKLKHPAVIELVKPSEGDLPMHPQHVLKLLREALPEDGILFVDIGNVMAWAIHYFQVTRPGTFVLNLGLASMGHAIPAAIGGKLAAPSRQVAALVGDAAFLMNGMEVHAAVELGLPVVWLVMNNGGHGMVFHGERLQFKGKFETSRFRRPVDIAAVAEGLGARGFRADTPEQLRTALAEAFSCGGPAVVDARVDIETGPPMSLRVETLNRFFSGEPAGASAS